MKAIRLHKAIGPTGLAIEEIDMPQPRKGEILVRVVAAAITRDELEWPVDRLPAIPSYEFSGVVSGTGPGVDEFKAGDAVYALSAFDQNGAAAEYISVPAVYTAPKPKTLDYIQSAAIPLPALTAWQGLFDHGHLTKGQRVLIHGAAGGVGHFAVQFARYCGATVIGTTSTANVPFAQQLGADKIIDTTTTAFEEVVGEVDLVFDTTGGERLERSPAIIRRGGKLISVATEPPHKAARELGVESLYFVVSPNREELAKIGDLVDRGEIKPYVSEVFPLSKAQEAFKRSLLHNGAGKIVIRVSEDQRFSGSFVGYLQ